MGKGGPKSSILKKKEAVGCCRKGSRMIKGTRLSVEGREEGFFLSREERLRSVSNFIKKRVDLNRQGGGIVGGVSNNPLGIS